MIKKILKQSLPLIDLLLIIPTLLSAVILRLVRRIGVRRIPYTKQCLMKIGVFPINDHYYEPMFNPIHLRSSLSQDRALPGIDWNQEGQLNLLKNLNYSQEISHWQTSATLPVFCIENGSYESGDAEIWYGFIRHFKPKKIIEIGSGYSTLIAQQAIQKNFDESGEKAEHLCIEPYEQPWLETTGVVVIRECVEKINIDLFKSLAKGDILFIDSSHIIRPQGDVLYEFLEVLPNLADGVIVHVHDIFSPKNYPESAIIGDVLFWNEQYILEAFLTHNKDWKIISAVNYLKHQHFEKLKECCPFLDQSREPGAFYIQKVKTTC